MSIDSQILLQNAIELIQSKEFQKGRELLEKAKSKEPKDPDIFRLLAVVAALEFDYPIALKHINDAIRLAPLHGIAHSNKGNILKELGRYEEALQSLDRAIALSPNYAEAYNNKGNVLQDLYRYEDAISYYDKAIQISPNYAQAYSNKGNALAVLQRDREALDSHNKALLVNPEYLEAYWNMATIQLSQGDFENGWRNYEARFFMAHPILFRYPQIQKLDSIENIIGKKILVWFEQGLGDTIQFSRYIKPLSDCGALVTFLVPTPLLGIMQSLSKFCTLIDEGPADLTVFDFQTPLLSLSLILRITPQTISPVTQYLGVDLNKKLMFEEWLFKTKSFKVGVVWNGGFRVESQWLWSINKRRNIELDQIAALRGVPGVDFYSLQKGDPAESELAARRDQVWPELINCADLLHDFSDTAALMECLDLIISVDTSSAHLAGALGKPVWILNRYDSCWRWLRGREDSPWYPTAKIYQQKTPGDWVEVIARVKVDLETLAQEKLNSLS